MNKIIGSVLCSLAFVVMPQPTAQLIIKDISGTPITRSSAGVPFNLECIIDGANSLQENPSIIGLDQCAVINQRSFNSMHIFNGKTVSQYRFSYTLRFDKPGTYTVGPAQAVIDHQNITVPAITIAIDKQTPQAPATDNKKSVVIKLDIAPRKYVVGERIPFTITAHVPDTVQLHALTPPTMPDATINNVEGPLTKREYIGNTSYKIMQWRGAAYAKKSGTLTFPAIGAEYRIPRKISPRDDIFHLLWSASTFDTEFTYSEPQIVTIQELPPFDKPILFIGHLDDMAITVTPTTIMQGNAATLNVQLTADANFDQVQFPVLNVPEHVQWYESTKKITPLQGKDQLTLEYIVQPTVTGTLTVPQQTWYYFDTLNHSYQKITIPPTELVITPAAGQPHNNIQDTTIQMPAAQALTTPSNATPPIRSWWSIMLPLPWLVGIIGGLLLLKCLLILGPIIERHYAIRRRLAIWLAFYHARGALKKNKSPYYIFRHVFIILTMKDITQQDMLDWLMQQQVPEEQRAAWLAFWHNVLQAHFAQESATPSLYQQGRVWLDYLQRFAR